MTIVPWITLVYNFSTNHS